MLSKKGYRYEGLGFPVQLMNIPFIEMDGELIPDIDFNELAGIALRALAEKPTRLTGDEVRFIRNHFELTLQDFASKFGVTHPAVLKWQKAGSRAIAATWSTEKDIRLFAVQDSLKPEEFLSLYKSLDEPKRAGNFLHVVDWQAHQTEICITWLDHAYVVDHLAIWGQLNTNWHLVVGPERSNQVRNLLGTFACESGVDLSEEPLSKSRLRFESPEGRIFGAAAWGFPYDQ